MRRKIIMFFALLALLSGCIGGGGSSSDDSDDSGSNNGNSTVEGLETPTTVSVVSAKDESGGSQVQSLQTNFGGLAKTISANFNDAGTQYSEDKANVYVWDESMEALEIVNEILCYMGQTGASDMVNQGAYIALINGDKCRQGENQSSAGAGGQSGGGQSSGGQTTRYEIWVINSTRADNDSPQYVSIWVPAEGGDHPEDQQNILVEVTVNEGVSDTRPFGSFVMNFKGVFDASEMDGSTEEVMMRGTLRTVDNDDGKIQFEFVNVGGSEANAALAPLGFSFKEASNVILDNADGDSGVAVTFTAYADDMDTENAAYALAFDSDHLLRGKDIDEDNTVDAEFCASRTDFSTQVWRYNLYHKTDGSFNGKSVTGGQRVKLDSGFPIRYDGKQGHIGYWGIWLEGDEAIPDGATVTRVNYHNNETSDYTLRVAPGKLIRREANTEALTSMQGDEFYFWGEHPSLGNNQYLVTVDGDNDFIITHQVQWGDAGPQTTDVVDATITPSDPGQTLWLWSDALGGNVTYLHNTEVAAADRQVTFYAERFIAANEPVFANGAVSLYCYDRCLKGGLTQTDIDNAHGETDLYYPTDGTAYQYRAEVSNGKVLVRDHLGALVSAAGLDMTDLGHDWGINTGEMLSSPIDGGDWWEVYNQEISYRWETGNNPWNQMISVVDGNGATVRFDRPLAFNYTHSTAQDANGEASYNGKKMLLQYGGHGELWGFPWKQEGHRWYSAVTLKDGTELTDGTNTFVVKAMEKEQAMREEPGACTELDVSGLLDDPDLALLTAADISDVSITLADKPVVTDPPAVIEGEVQTEE